MELRPYRWQCFHLRHWSISSTIRHSKLGWWDIIDEGYKRGWASVSGGSKLLITNYLRRFQVHFVVLIGVAWWYNLRYYHKNVDVQYFESSRIDIIALWGVYHAVHFRVLIIYSKSIENTTSSVGGRVDHKRCHGIRGHGRGIITAERSTSPLPPFRISTDTRFCCGSRTLPASSTTGLSNGQLGRWKLFSVFSHYWRVFTESDVILSLVISGLHSKSLHRNPRLLN